MSILFLPVFAWNSFLSQLITKRFAPQLFPPFSPPAAVARARSDSLMHGFLCGNASLHYSTLLRARPALHPFSHPRSSLYFCHENGPRPSSLPPATSIIISSSRSPYKIYRPSTRSLSAFLMTDQSPTIDSLISRGRCVQRKKSAKILFFFPRADNVIRICSFPPSYNIYGYSSRVRLLAKLL